MKRKKRVPSRREERALKIGADELMNMIEWKFHKRPRTLRNARKRFREFCVEMMKLIEKRN